MLSFYTCTHELQRGDHLYVVLETSTLVGVREEAKQSPTR